MSLITEGTDAQDDDTVFIHVFPHKETTMSGHVVQANPSQDQSRVFRAAINLPPVTGQRVRDVDLNGHGFAPSNLTFDHTTLDRVEARPDGAKSLSP